MIRPNLHPPISRLGKSSPDPATEHRPARLKFRFILSGLNHWQAEHDSASWIARGIAESRSRLSPQMGTPNSWMEISIGQVSGRGFASRFTV